MSDWERVHRMMDELKKFNLEKQMAERVEETQAEKEARWAREEDVRETAKQRTQIHRDRELAAERADLMNMPAVIEAERLREQARGMGWFVGLSEQVKTSPGAWVYSMKRALELAALPGVSASLEADLKSWVNGVAHAGFRKAVLDGPDRP